MINKNLPFTTFDDPALKNTLTLATQIDNSKLTLSARSKSDLLKFTHDKNFQGVKAILRSNSSKISFTTDMWTSAMMDPFMAIIAYFITDECV